MAGRTPIGDQAPGASACVTMEKARGARAPAFPCFLAQGLGAARFGHPVASAAG